MNDYVITEHDEILTRSEANRWNHKIVGKPTKEDIEEYEKEEAHMRKEGQENEHAGSYHELSD